MLIKEISSSIDSCAGLIAQKARKTYASIPPENKRWIELDDVLQEGLLEAWRAETQFKPTFNTKYSTYLFRGLDMAYSAAYWIPFTRRKRMLSGMVEIDAAPADSNLDLASADFDPEKIQIAVSSFMAVCRALSPDALVLMLQFVLDDGKFCGHITRYDMSAVKEIRAACRRFDVRPDAFLTVHENVNAKNQVLVEIGGLVKDQSDPSTLNVLECSSCRLKFSLSDVKAGLYVISSLLCKDCLQKLRDSDASLTCFGKRKEVSHNRTLVEGYSEDDVECRLLCRDRVACKMYSERGTVMAKSAVEDELEDVDFGDVDVDSDAEETDADDSAEEEQVEEPTNEKSVKSAKPAKVAKTVKSAKVSKPAKSAKPAKAAKTEKVAKIEKIVKADKTVKTAKAAKPAKPAKVVKAEKPAKTHRKAKSTAKIDAKAAKDRIVLDAEGRDLPFKPKSMMRYVLTQALLPSGAKEADLEKQVKNSGYNWKFQRAVLVSGQSGNSSLRPYPSTHTWKVDLTVDGRIRVYDVKRIAFYEKMARIDGR